MGEGGGTGTTSKEAMEANILLWYPGCKQRQYLCASKRQDMGLDSVQHQ